MVREQIVSKRVEILTDLSRIVGEQLLDRDGPAALDAEVPLEGLVMGTRAGDLDPGCSSRSAAPA